MWPEAGWDGWQGYLRQSTLRPWSICYFWGLHATRGSFISYHLEMNFVTFSLMVDLQIRVFRVGGMGCFQLVSSIKVSLLIKAFCLRGRTLVFVYRVSQKKATINLFDLFLVFWTRSKVVQKDLKGTKMVNPTSKCSLSIQGKISFIWNGSKGSRWVQRGPKWSKTLGLTILVPFEQLWNVF